MDELDEKLEQLVLDAQQHPPQTRQRQMALGKLIHLIQQSGKLYCKRGQLRPDVYNYLYREALQEVWLDICRNINKYDPAKAKVMTWVNFLLDKRFIDARDKYYMNPKAHITYVPEMADLDRAALSEDAPSLSQEVKRQIEADPEQIFQTKHIQHYPEANFQFLAKRRLSGDSWEKISAELGIKVPTLSTFYQRCCKQFAPKLKEYLQQ